MRFWEESWANNTNLKSVYPRLYPRLYSQSLDHGLKVVEVGIWVDLVWVWKLRWRCSGFEWESTLHEELLRFLSGVKLNKEMKDCMTWKGKPIKERHCGQQHNSLCPLSEVA